MLTLRRALIDLLTVFGTAGRLLAAHWPQLVGLFLAGWAARMGILWLAVAVSASSATAAVLLLPLAPLATLLSLILMLRVVAESLPAFAELFAPKGARARWHDHLSAAALVLLPFLALYASQGLLKADSQLFLWDARADTFMNQQSWWAVDARSDYASGPALIAMVVGALVLRKVLSLLDLAKKSVGWSLAATYLEALWLVTLASALTNLAGELRSWVATRKVMGPVVSAWDQVVAFATQFAPVKRVIDALIDLVNNLGDMVVIPVAWLAIGAAVYSAKLTGRDFEGHEVITKRLATVPSPVKRVVGQVVEPITTPVKDAATAVGKIAAAGVLPMVVFCVIFVLTSQLKVAVAWLFRAAVGSRRPFELYSLAPYSDMLQRLVYFVVALTLVAAAVNRIVLNQPTETAEDAVPASA